MIEEEDEIERYHINSKGVSVQLWHTQICKL